MAQTTCSNSWTRWKSSCKIILRDLMISSWSHFDLSKVLFVWEALEGGLPGLTALAKAPQELPQERQRQPNLPHGIPLTQGYAAILKATNEETEMETENTKDSQKESNDSREWTAFGQCFVMDNKGTTLPCGSLFVCLVVGMPSQSADWGIHKSSSFCACDSTSHNPLQRL